MGLPTPLSLCPTQSVGGWKNGSGVGSAETKDQDLQSDPLISQDEVT